MNFKKIVLSGLCVVSIGGLSFSQIDASILSNKYLKPNVVYTKTDDSLYNNDNRSLEQVYREEFVKSIKKYFSVDVKLDSKEAYGFFVILVNEETLKKEEEEEQKILKSSLDKKEISVEKYKTYLSRLEGRLKKQREMLMLLKHDMVVCQFVYGKDYAPYSVVFDASTKEVLDASCPFDNPGSPKNNGELPKVSIEYIKKHNLGGLTNPELVTTYGEKNNNLIYQEQGDPSKKVVLNFNASTHQLFGIMTKHFATNLYNQIISEKSN